MKQSNVGSFMNTDNLTPMIAKGARMKHAVLRAVSFFGLCLGFCAFLLMTSIEVHSANDASNENNLPKEMRLSINESSSALNDISSDQNLKTNTLIKGIVTEKRFLPKISTREYEYSVLRSQDGWYSIRLVSQQTNVMSEAYSDLVDTIVENAPTEALTGVMPSPEKYTRRFSISPTPYPLCADSMLQAVWLTLCADRNAMANSISKCPPGIIFTYPMRFDPYNIYSLIVENEIYDEFGEMGYRIVDKVWPLTGTESYQKWKELFIQKTLFEEHNYNAPKSFLTIILILLILASPFIVNFIKWKKSSKVKRIIK
jgi:hypothetical protein